MRVTQGGEAVSSILTGDRSNRLDGKRNRCPSEVAMTSENRTFLVIIITIIAVHFVLREATFEKATVRKGESRFPPVMGFRAAVLIGAPLELFGAYELFHQVRSISDWFLPMMLLVFALGTVYFDPGTITINASDITHSRYFGFSISKIAWNDVESAVTSKTLKTISVFAPGGRSIVHTQFQVDPLRFESELKRHVKVPVIEQ